MVCPHPCFPLNSLLTLITGPVCRYGPNKLSFNTSTALHTIYGVKSNARKSDFYHLFTAPGALPSVFSVINKDQHTQKRRVLAHAFSDKALRNMEKYVLMHIRKFCSKLNEGEPMNISNWISYLTFDVMGELCFGKTFGMLEGGENRWVLNVSGRHSLIVSYLSHSNL
jgi:cytochrome P450